MSTPVIYGTKQKGRGSKVTSTRALYTDETGTDNGEWLSTFGWDHAYIVVNGITTGTVNFRAWNGSSAPAASEHGEAAYGIATSGATLVATLTADGVVSFPRHMLPMFFKVYISVATNITLDVDLKIVYDS